jgi:Holliday junction resolvase RusA-like endonuclease
MEAYAKRVEALFIEAKALNPDFEILRGPVMLTISAFFHVKGASTGWYTGDPDLSNLEKLIEDALEGLAYENDNQIVAHGTEHGKRITSASREEGVHVSVYSLERPRAVVAPVVGEDSGSQSP